MTLNSRRPHKQSSQVYNKLSFSFVKDESVTIEIVCVVFISEGLKNWSVIYDKGSVMDEAEMH